MPAINKALTTIVDIGFAPFAGAPAWASLLACSALFAVIGLVVFKLTSNQSGVRLAKRRIKADMLSIKLFGDEPGNILAALCSIIANALRMLRYSLLPMAVMLIPFVLIVAQLALRYHWRPIQPGEAVVVTAQLPADADPMHEPPVLLAPEGVTVETPAVRAPSEAKVYWRVRASHDGVYTLRVQVGDDEVEKSLTVGNDFSRVSTTRVTAGSWQSVISPAETPIIEGSVAVSVSVGYPLRDDWVGGVGAWIAWLILGSWLVAFLLKPILRVEF